MDFVLYKFDDEYYLVQEGYDYIDHIWEKVNKNRYSDEFVDISYIKLMAEKITEFHV